MARLRTLKPSFFLNDTLAEIHPLGRLLFQGLWCIADREGRLEDRPTRIKAEVLPYDKANVDKLLNDLAARGFITRYAVGQSRYIQVRNFSKHQNPHQKEAASTIPAPGQHSESTGQVSGKEDASNESGADLPGSTCLVNGLGEIGIGSVVGVQGESDDSTPPQALPKQDKRATALPANFAVDSDMRAWAAKNTPTIAVEKETEQFCDYCRANGKTYKDWHAAWRNWMSNALKFETKTRSNGHAAGKHTYAETRLAVGAAGSFGDRAGLTSDDAEFWDE